MRIAFTGNPDSGSFAAAAYTVGKVGGQLLRFDTLLEDAARGVCNTFNFAYTKDPELLDFLRTWAKTRYKGVFLSDLADRINDDDANYIIGDLRNKDDATILRSLNFVLVLVTRPVISKTLPASKIEWDFELRNCGTRSHFEWQVDQMLRLIERGEHQKLPRRTLTII